MEFVTYEDRPSDCVGLKLLAASILKSTGSHTLICFCPTGFVAFRKWATQHPRLIVRDSDELGVRGWEVKPTLLLKLLDDGIAQPIWVDSDIVMSRPISEKLFAIHGRELLATEENSSHSNVAVNRAELSHLISARQLHRPLNSGVLRVSEVHRSLLQAWAERMSRPDFQTAQQNDSVPRPTHLAGDQDVLEALLCSREYADIPVRELKAGIEIAQCWFVSGFAFRHRLRALLFGLPPIVHALGIKPWRVNGNRLTALAAELHPYNRVARRLADGIDEDMPWSRPKTGVARILTILGCGSAVLPGILLLLGVRLYQTLSRWRRRFHPDAHPRLNHISFCSGFIQSQDWRFDRDSVTAICLYFNGINGVAHERNG